MRFRRRITIAPGLRLNLSGSGLSLSAGPRGASVTLGSRGVWGNVGIPGTGLSSRHKLSGSSSSTRSGRLTKREQEALLIDEFYASAPRLSAPLAGGAIDLQDRDGNPLPTDVQAAVWKHLRNDLLGQLSERCDALKADIESLAKLHEHTPPPDPVMQYVREEFREPEPAMPRELSYHWLWKWFPQHRQRIDQQNDAARDAYFEVHRQWLDARATHDRQEHRLQKLYRLRDEGTGTGIEEFISAHLATLQWPKDTAVDLSFDADRGRVCLDVDFPEIEDLPEGIPEPAPRTRELRIKRFSDAARRSLYAAHIHSVLFRLIGESFRTSVAVNEVVASGYSQHPDRATGVIRDEYLISVRIDRAAWREIDFGNLGHVDPIQALARRPIRRKMTKTGMFQAIEPFA